MLRSSYRRLNPPTVSETVRKHCYGTWRPQKGWNPLHITRAEGCYFWDASGKKYLDLTGQLMCCNLGHGNEAILKAMNDQAKQVAFVAPGYCTGVRAELSRKLLDIVPKGIDKFFYCTSGTEGNEAAVKIAKLFTGKQKIIARYNTYHGSTTTSVSLTSDHRHWLAEKCHATIGGVIHMPECNSYRPAPFKHASEGLAYLDYLLKNEDNVAAIIVEPVVGTNGVLIPPDDYLPGVRKLTKEHGVLMIADEVMSGWGRTGEWFAINKWGVSPDIIVSAKGITNAMFPLGMVGTTREISDFFEEGWFCHGHTYESHPLGLAAACAAIEEYKRLDLINRSREMEKVFAKKLGGLKDRHRSVGDVRGCGLFWAVECVKNRETKEPFSTFKDKIHRRPMLIDQAVAKMAEKGVYCVGWMSHFIVAPPLIITESEMDEAVAAFDAALEILDKHVQG
jgi:taurine--2-oxoglutarate transaminase